jgi:hypothetical protein
MNANAVCSDGIAATGLDASTCSAFSVLPAPCRPIASHPFVEMRSASISEPCSGRAAHHGGAAG